jgi:hypothetical protein
VAEVFISYAREDRDFADAVCAALQRSGFSAWMDVETKPGEFWNERIVAELSEARVVVVLWSRYSVKSRFVHDEATLATEAGKLLPVSIDGTRPPLGFGIIQTIDLRGWNRRSDDPSVARMVAGIHDRARQLNAPPRDATNDNEDRGKDDGPGNGSVPTRVKVALGTVAGFLAVGAIGSGLVAWLGKGPNELARGLVASLAASSARSASMSTLSPPPVGLVEEQITPRGYWQPAFRHRAIKGNVNLSEASAACAGLELTQTKRPVYSLCTFEAWSLACEQTQELGKTEHWLLTYGDASRMTVAGGGGCSNTPRARPSESLAGVLCCERGVATMFPAGVSEALRREFRHRLLAIEDAVNAAGEGIRNDAAPVLALLADHVRYHFGGVDRRKEDLRQEIQGDLDRFPETWSLLDCKVDRLDTRSNSTVKLPPESTISHAMFHCDILTLPRSGQEHERGQKALRLLSPRWFVLEADGLYSTFAWKRSP